jgi:outer membrane protein assembly factor BamA
LGSDFVYTRHELTAEYNYEPSSKSKVTASLLAGRATGNAPMFERFSLGNAIRLRGWNKYEIDPLGGNRVLYGSGSYTYRFVTGFYDIGAVWDAHQSSITRQSAGFTLGSFQCKGARRIIPLCWVSLTVGFPIHGGGEHPSIIIGM